MQQTTRDFWNDRYRDKTGDTSGKPGLVLSQFAGPLAPGRALELGCGRGDDALWLARQGWQVTAVDVSAVALAYPAIPLLGMVPFPIGPQATFARWSSLQRSFPGPAFRQIARQNRMREGQR